MTNNCCGCFPPITEYNASNACQQPTLLQQVNYLTELLKKYPAQQFFISTDKVTEETIKITVIKNDSNRQINTGDFIFANTENGSTLVFTYTGATDKDGKYIVDYVGTYGVAMDELLKTYEKATQALELAQTNEQDISLAEARINELMLEASVEVTITPASATSGTLTQEQFNALKLNDNSYIRLNEVIYTLSKNSATGVLIYSSKYLSDSKTMRTITVTRSTRAWVMTEVAVSGGESLYENTITLKYQGSTAGWYVVFYAYTKDNWQDYGYNALTFDFFDAHYDLLSVGFLNKYNDTIYYAPLVQLCNVYHISSSLYIKNIIEGNEQKFPIDELGESGVGWSGSNLSIVDVHSRKIL